MSNITFRSPFQGPPEKCVGLPVMMDGKKVGMIVRAEGDNLVAEVSLDLAQTRRMFGLAGWTDGDKRWFSTKTSPDPIDPFKRKGPLDG